MNKPQLIVALDLPSSQAIPRILDTLPPDISWFKVGLELFAAEGPECLKYLRNSGKNVFLDLKLHDIPRTVARAVSSCCEHGVSMLTLHACGGKSMLAAAREAASAASNPPILLAVTTLTSLNDDDLQSIGISRPLKFHTIEIGKMAVQNGANGLVCSTLEVSDFRRELGPSAVLVTPGIRPAGSDIGDQKRIATPYEAVSCGSNFLVVGRPILDAASPRDAATEILRQMASALSP